MADDVGIEADWFVVSPSARLVDDESACGRVIPAPRNIPLIRPTLGTEEAEAAQRVILSGWVTQGPEVAAFERDFSELVGARHACAVSSCTAALHLALLALGVGPGDEVVTVSHSYIATSNAIRYCGATPVFVDIEAATRNIDPALLEQAFTSRTKAVLCVHQVGMPCDLAKVISVANARGVPVVEDAACAAGSEILWDGKWEPIGRPHGAVACFSFHPRKIVSTGDGGMLTTSDPDLDQMFRLQRQHGMSVSDQVRHRSGQVIFEEHNVLGYNYRLTDIQAAVGRVQLRRLPGTVVQRRVLAGRYRELLGGIPGIVPPVEPRWARSNWQSYTVGLPDWCDQREVMQAMLDRGVATRRGIMCAHREQPYTRPSGYDLPVSEWAQDRQILLPLYPQMDDDDVRYVCAVLAEACRHQSSN